MIGPLRGAIGPMGLWKMLPCFALDDVPYGRFSYAILAPKNSASCKPKRIFMANLDNLLFGQPGETSLSAHRLSGLFHHVGDVVGICSKKQVIGTDAPRMIAPMAYMQPIGNGAIVQFVAVAMCAYRLSVKTYASIAARLKMRSPSPTTIRFVLVNVHPEALLYGKWTCNIVSGNEAKRLAFYPSTARMTTPSEWREVPASALAVTVWGFIRGIIERHGDLQSRCVKSQGIDVPLGHLFVGLHYTTLGTSSPC